MTIGQSIALVVYLLIAVATMVAVGVYSEKMGKKLHWWDYVSCLVWPLVLAMAVGWAVGEVSAETNKRDKRMKEIETLHDAAIENLRRSQGPVRSKDN